MSPVRDGFPVVLTRTRGGAPMAAGVLTAGDLVDRYVIPRRDSRRKTGYQREVSTTRVNRLMKDLRSGRVDLPTSVLVNIREFDRSKHLREDNGVAMLQLKDQQLHVVDGQHRVEALARLVQEDEKRWADFELPFVAMLGASESEEIRQFYVVNSTAKSVRTDLALDLLKQRAESEPGVLDALVESGETWKVKGQHAVEHLERTSPLWQGRIRFPGEPRGRTTIGSAGFVSSLRAVLNTPYFGQIADDHKVTVLGCFWEGVEQVIPEAFKDPSEYTLQKSTGVLVMHSVLVTVLEHVRAAGRSVLEPDAYAEVMRQAFADLEGDNSEGYPVRGGDFWLSGSEGAAGSYSSNAGRRVLIAKIKNLLPPIEVE